MITPSQFDLDFAAHLASFVNRYPRFDQFVDSAIHHYILGGFCYAVSLFYYWSTPESAGYKKIHARIWTTLIGMLIAILLGLGAARVIAWQPPSQSPQLAHFYENFESNHNNNSFPSASMTVYTAIAMGIYSISRRCGLLLLGGLPLLIALPRIYAGGHYPTDVLAGGALGVVGFLIARYLLEPWVVSRLQYIIDRSRGLRVLSEVIVFVCIWQVLVEFREAVWIRDVIANFG